MADNDPHRRLHRRRKSPAGVLLVDQYGYSGEAEVPPAGEIRKAYTAKLNGLFLSATRPLSPRR